MSELLTIVWYRQDLRTEDHPALLEACRRGNVLPVYIYGLDGEGDWELGDAAKWRLYHSLKSLAKDLKALGTSLIIRQGNALEVLRSLIKETGATAVFWSRRYEPSCLERDAEVKNALRKEGVIVESSCASLLFEPWTIANKQGKPFQIFTPFWKACLSKSSIDPPLPKPKNVRLKSLGVTSLSLNDLNLLSKKLSWDKKIKEERCKPGSEEAKICLLQFLKGSFFDYQNSRDFPAVEGISRMSAYLHFGEISPRMIWHSVMEVCNEDKEAIGSYLRQIGWREFAHYLLYHFPQTQHMPLRKNFLDFPWKKNAKHLQRWQKGQTGYPFVDAGMRQLMHTGWMHNRVRLVVGSFLVKHLLISWTEGAQWFWNTLVDADLANNTLGWQWVSGCGADAAPYFRIFNPIAQGEKFDSEGSYVRKWVPELKDLPNAYLHKPWEAPEILLRQANIVLGSTYPYPIVDHVKARAEALEAFASLRM